IESSKEFTKRKEAMIAKIYNTDEIEMRIFNSDGGSWIKTLYEKDDSVHCVGKQEQHCKWYEQYNLCSRQ
ncbi:MAG: hypothetical protein U0L92_05725, partial [Clostridia bacterium]|nr:hypothetical protein [Clostridia bacterium]